MKEKLGLTDAQAKKMEAAWQEHWEAIKPLREQMRTARRKVHGELEIEAPDKDIQAALDQVEKTREALRAEGAQFKKTMDSMLTTIQRAKMLVMREKMMRHGLSMGRHGQQDCERGWHEGNDREGWRMGGHGDDRGERHGPEGWKGGDSDQEQEDD
jgi:Spy/CpxP family protein refolding chaperone